MIYSQQFHFIKVTIVMFLLLMSFIRGYSQYTCSTPHAVLSLPYSASELPTTETGFLISGICNIDYNEQDYLFKYSPSVEGEVNIEIVTYEFIDQAGIYVFDNCDFVPTNCIAFAESTDGTVNLSFEVGDIQDYYIFIGTAIADKFDVIITRTSVAGVAINKSDPTQTLDINGSIRINEGNTPPYAGTIRWNSASGDFEGYDGSVWIALTNKPDPTPPIVFGYSPKVGAPMLNIGDASLAFGTSVALDGDMAIVGAPGYLNYGMANIYHKEGSSWVLEDVAVPSDNTSGMKFGSNVSISGSIAIVGAPGYDVNGNSNQGKAYIYKRVPNGISAPYWLEHAIIEASDGAANDQFGWSVSVDGNRVLIGINSPGIGKTYVYRDSGSSWVYESTIIPSDGVANDRFGIAVSLSEDKAVIGAESANVNGSNFEGKSYIYKRSGNLLTGFVWTEEAILTASDGIAGDRFGNSVDIDGNYAAIGSRLHDPNNNSAQGKTYVFRRQYIFPNGPFVWEEQSQLTSSDGQVGDNFGTDVSLEGDYLVIGASYHDTNGNANQGKSYVFKRNGTEWQQYDILIGDSDAVGDRFGSSVSISGEHIMVGAPFKNIGGFLEVGQVFRF